jgi:hypothetical protein
MCSERPLLPEKRPISPSKIHLQLVSAFGRKQTFFTVTNLPGLNVRKRPEADVQTAARLAARDYPILPNRCTLTACTVSSFTYGGLNAKQNH